MSYTCFVWKILCLVNVLFLAIFFLDTHLLSHGFSIVMLSDTLRMGDLFWRKYINNLWNINSSIVATSFVDIQKFFIIEYFRCYVIEINKIYTICWSGYFEKRILKCYIKKYIVISNLDSCFPFPFYIINIAYMYSRTDNKF